MKISLRAARVNAGYSREEAAKLLGIAKYSLARYERGEAFPRVDTAKRIMQLYRIPFDDVDFRIPVDTNKRPTEN